MSDKVKAALWRLTGGRPMTRLGFLFRDVISGASVHQWRDKLGREWMAEGAWDLFRVPVPPEPTDD